ncbi:MAG: hypothetical protein HXX13_09700 [Bacteroidetes bacterium]|nr:hypothetical protein [Bacteroidota bacterium]
MTLKLKSTTSFRAIHVNGLEDQEIREHEYQYQYSEYDDAGHLLMEITYLSDGSIEHKSSYRYSPEGNLVEELLIEEDDFVSEHRTMEYNESGKLWKEQNHYMDGSYDETIYQYDEEGILQFRETTGEDGEKGNKVKYEYLVSRPVSEIETDPDGDIVSEKKVEYDEAGNVVMELLRSHDEYFELLHEYDDKGFRSVTRKYNEQEELIGRITYERDADGRSVLIKEETVTGIEVMTLEYDAQGNIILQDTVSDTGDPISCIERTYDVNGQQITTTVHIEGRGQIPPQDYRIRFESEYFS